MGRRTCLQIFSTFAFCCLFVVPSIGVALADESGYWTARLPMPTARVNLGVCSFNGTIYAIGGQIGDLERPQYAQYLNVCEAYNPVANTWSTRASMPSGRASFGIAIASDKIYIIGGNDGSQQDNLNYEYDPAADNWTEKTPQPHAHGFCAATVDDKIYSITFDTKPYISSYVDEYDPLTDSWTTVTSVPQAVAEASAAAVGNKVYLIGGVYQHSIDCVNFNQVYAPATNTWSTGAPIPSRRYDAAIAVSNDRIYVIGGHTSIYSTDITNISEVYDPLADAWESATPMQTTRVYFGAAAINGSIYAIGGCRSISSTYVFYTKNEVYTIPEFSSILALLPLMATALVVVVILKRIRERKSNSSYV